MKKKKNIKKITLDFLINSTNDKKFIEKALLHPSHGGKDFQRLEFLGDRALGLIIAQKLYQTYTNDDEGLLAKKYAYLTSGYVCAKIAKNINLQKKIIVSRNLVINESILGDSMEALLGAIYLDTNIKYLQEVILNLWQNEIISSKIVNLDSKTALQEWSQSKGLGLPIYEIFKKEGLAHLPFFEVKVKIKGYKELLGKGNSKQNAELDAAKNFIKINL